MSVLYGTCKPASEWGDLATPARRMHVHKSLVSYSSDMDAFIAILHAHRENVHVNFHWGGGGGGVCATLIFCYKISSVALVSPCKSTNFSL